MRVLYIDIDSQRPDHLGCYGYHRQTSPNIDRIAARGLRFDNVYVSDAPCLPSRSALFSGRFGTHTGVINHGGAAADPFIDGPGRGFSSILGRTSWARALKNAGLHTATVSPFGERHSAWHFYANFHEVHNPGRRGLESAEEIAPIALDWLERRGRDDNWFLHVNLWDPHTPYRAPASVGDPFADSPLPGWLTEDVRAQHWAMCGPHSAQEPIGFGPIGDDYKRKYPRQPYVIDSMDAVRRMFDGYDTGVLYADRWVGEMLAALERLGIADDTAILVSADHGENLGELNVYGDHQTADQHTTRVPLVLHWPGVTEAFAGQSRDALHYQFDVAASLIELLGASVPDNWDGVSFADALRSGADAGRDHLVVTQGAWTCQRGVRFRRGDRELLYIHTRHDGYHGYPDDMLFDLLDDPHEQSNLADSEPGLATAGRSLLDEWHQATMRSATHPVDPMDTVLAEGGPKHTRGELPDYLVRLRATNRGHWADFLEARESTS